MSSRTSTEIVEVGHYVRVGNTSILPAGTPAVGLVVYVNGAASSCVVQFQGGLTRIVHHRDVSIVS